MPITVVDRHQAGEWLAHQIGAASIQLCMADYAELWRLAVLHSPGQSRGSAIRTIGNQFEPLDLNLDLLQEAFNLLLWQGDLLEVHGRKLYPAPLREITLADGALLVGTLTRNHLAGFTGKIAERGCSRFREGPGDSAFERWLESLGGKTITPETWAGLPRFPNADDAFLASLQGRPTSVPENESLQRFSFETGKWETPQTPSDGIWREPGDFRTNYWLRTRSQWRSLNQDEANRCLFALARREQTALARIERKDGAVTCSFRAYLPRAEYRFLCVQALARERLNFVFDAQRWNEVAEVLKWRLGLNNLEDQP